MQVSPSSAREDVDPQGLLSVLSAMRRGDFSVRMPEDHTGLAGKIADTLNDILEMQERMVGEYARVGHAVGKEGRISVRVAAPSAGGGWARATDTFNELIGDLTRPTQEMARVIGAVSKGDLTQRVPLDVEGQPLQGEFLQSARVANSMVDRLGAFASEVTRVAREVGTEGKLGGQATVSEISGTWKDLTDSVNGMASNLTAQVRNISEVATAVASGDLSRKITVDVRGEFLQLKDTINTMVDQLRVLGSEVTRVAREVGTDGKLGGQAVVLGVAGTWKDLTESVNQMASNLTGQVRNIAAVTTAVARGDLTRKVTVDVQGEVLELKRTINTMVDQLRAFSSEVTRVAREVGTEGNLGGQAVVPEVAGIWKDLADSVNQMASNLTGQVRNIALVTTAVANGDLSKKITVDVQGEILELKNTINRMVDQLNGFASEVTRVAREVGTEGKLGGQAEARGQAGTWKDLTDNVNQMAANLTAQVRNIAEVTTAVAKGDLTRKVTVDVRGEVLELKRTINAMVDQLRAFSSEVTRVAREVGTEGKLGGQAVVPDVDGTWKDLTDRVNQMASNLTAQVRDIAEVTTAVANGDLSKKITVDVEGEILELKNTINRMVDQLNGFASEVTRVAREVGTEGKLGGQAEVEGVAGVWKDLTDNVNQMGANLTAQVRNIAEVTTAVAQGDLSKTITVDVQGEMLELKRTINDMVEQLNAFAFEVVRVAREVGTEGQLGGQAQVPGAAGTWKALTDNVNLMASNLTGQVRNIAEVTTAVAKGDLTKKITVDVRGEILELKNTINTMVDQLNGFASEVTRVAREVGTDGKLGGQAKVRGVAGTWKDLTDSVNQMASNLTAQVRNIAEVTTAVARGELGRKITVDVRGEILELKNTMNTMVDQLNAFASEVTRVAREVGTEGKLGGQANVRGAAGTWKDLTDSVNQMAANLTAQVRNIAEVTTAVAKGDLTRTITVDVKGEILELKLTINTMVDQLNGFAGEVTRVAREVGTEGKLGGQAYVRGVGGTWKDLTDSVNQMAANLTAQVRNIAEVTTAVANGDLDKKITVDARGEILELKTTINTMVDQLNAFASEVTRVAREVGTEGKLGGQAAVRDVAGTWKDLTDSVNQMASNLTDQVRNIAEVTTAVASGDLSKKITVPVKGEILQLKNTMNTMVDQLNGFASEVTRVAREVGTDGKLGGQANVRGVAGTWKDLTDSVNQMAANLTDQVRNIAEVTTAVASGDLSKKITVNVKGEILALKITINTMVDQLNAFASEVTRVAREVGIEGRLGGQANVRGVAGTWKDLTDNVNLMASNLTAQVRNIAEVTTAVAMGDLSRKITVNVRGEILALKNTINTMVDQLNGFAGEVTRVAREVGTDGKLGGQANVPGVAGTWKDLTDNVNSMAANLTTQVRGIAKVVTAVANGNLSRRLSLEAGGEIAELVETINGMTDTLAVFAEQVTSVAREVGIEGRLGGQARVPGAAGTWRDLTDNVNQLAANLTTQVRAIAEVATAVARGDLTRSVQVEAAGEVALLKDNVNQMIRNLQETTGKNTEQDWLKTNLTRLTQLLQGQRDATAVTQSILSEVSPLVGAPSGAFFLYENGEEEGRRPGLVLGAAYGWSEGPQDAVRLSIGETLVGQCAQEKAPIRVIDAPHDFAPIRSGLGQAPPLDVIVLPVLFESQVKGVLELASFSRFTTVQLDFLEQLTESIGIVLNTIEASTRTEELLKQSQSLATELQLQQDELTETNRRLEAQARTLRENEDHLRRHQDDLRRANEQLEERTRMLSARNAEVERKNREVERARVMLEEKAEQLALTSRYKSQFLANMSHELRTPLNSLLILSKLLAENEGGNLSPKQAEYARMVHTSGTDLLGLINGILDLAKIESGKVELEVGEVSLRDLRRSLERSFETIAQAKGLGFKVTVDRALPAVVRTDGTRLQQILRNLLSNAFKFTDRGEVTVRVRAATGGWGPGSDVLDDARHVLAFDVTDTGCGIPHDKHDLVFEAFQQADGTTSRKFGGTGLGLSISRELARILGGVIRLESEEAKGSVFTLYLPDEYVPVPSRSPDSHGGNGMGSDHGTSQLVAATQGGTLPIDDLEEEAWVPDDREDLHAGDRAVLIVEDDVLFARILLDIAREKGFRGVVATRALEAVLLARQHAYAAVTLDLHLSDRDGWFVLDALKHDPVTRHVWVHIVSVEPDWRRGMRAGATSFLRKPVSREEILGLFDAIAWRCEHPSRELLVAEPDAARSSAIREMVRQDDVRVTTADTGRDTLAALNRARFDCLVLSGHLPDMSAAEVVESALTSTGRALPPVVVDGNRELTSDELERLDRHAAAVVVADGASLEQVLRQTSLFLHLPMEGYGPHNARAQAAQASELAGRRVLIVDDDARNLFSLAAILERHGIEVVRAETGREGIAKLHADEGIHVVLMDVMMPEVDGYEAMRTIRENPRFRDLPIVAVTARAMKGDRERCIEAGATDYVAKPVDEDQLISTLRVAMQR